MKKPKRAISTLLVTGMVAMSLAGCAGDDTEAVNNAGSVDEKESGNEAESNAEDTKNEESEKTKKLAGKVVDGLKENKINSGKDETVYVVMNNDGSVSSISVSDVLKNVESGTVKDVSELNNITNLKGNEGFDNDGTDMTWQSEGNDITYQGTTDKELPVGVEISYKLDGKKVSAEELAGAAGHVEVNYNYTNNTGTSKDVNGEMKDVIVPFVAASGMMLSSDKCANVTIDNGKVIEEGDNIVVVGYAIPGLKDCITEQIEDSEKIFEKINIGDSFTVEADVTDFEVDMALTIVLPDVIGSEDLEDIETDEISDKIDELSDASEQLADGSSKLDDGADELKSGAKDLNKGASKLKNGASDLKSGTNELYKGAGDLNKGASDLKKGAKDLDKGVNTLDKGASDLDKGVKDLEAGGKSLSTGAKDISTNLGTLSTGATSLEGGAKQVYDGTGSLKTNVETFQTKAGDLVTGIGTVASGITTVDGYMKQIVAGFEDTDGQTGLVNGSKQVADGVKELIAMLKNSTESIDVETDNIMKQVKQASGIEDKDTLAATVQGLETAIKANQSTVPVTTILSNASGGMITSYEQYSALCQANYSITALEEVKTKLNSMVSENSAKLAGLEAGAAGVSSGINTVYAGLSTLSTNISTLNEGGNKLVAGSQAVNQGFIDLLNGISTLQTGAKTLYDGAKTLNDGAGKLNTGAATLSQGAASLYSGITTLKNGTATLAAGTGTLKEGSGKLYSGTDTLYKGAYKLYKGTGDLNDGAGKLYDGLGDLSDGTEKLFGGTKSLKDGTRTLSEGMLEFNTEAITPITELFGQKLSDAYDLMYSIAEEGDAYNNFTGISDDMDGTVKFIYKTNGIKKSEEE